MCHPKMATQNIQNGHSRTMEHGNGPCRIGAIMPLQDMTLHALRRRPGMGIVSWSKSIHRPF